MIYSCYGHSFNHQVWPSDFLELCYSLLVTIVQVGFTNINHHGHHYYDHDPPPPHLHHHHHHCHHLANVQFLLPLLVAGIANAAIYCKLKVPIITTNNYILIWSLMMTRFAECHRFRGYIKWKIIKKSDGFIGGKVYIN